MNWKTAFVSGMLGAGLFLSFVPGATAESGDGDEKSRRDHNRAVEQDHNRAVEQDHAKAWESDHRGNADERWWKDRNDRERSRYTERSLYDRDHRREWNDDDRDDRYRRDDRDDWYRAHRYRDRNSGACRKLRERIENDRGRIADIEPSGRHRKALQWFKDDLRNADRDMARCGG